MNARWFLPWALLLSLALPAGAGGQAMTEAQIEAVTRELASKMRCPVCQGVSIQDSPTELAVEMKNVIRQQLVEGQTPDEVKAYFVARYGEWVLLEPERKGFNLVVWLLPWFGLLAGGGMVVVLVRRWTRVPPSEVDLAGIAGPDDPEET
jgi:cytochrome c-type biogenesis protein CcmH